MAFEFKLEFIITCDGCSLQIFYEAERGREFGILEEWPDLQLNCFDTLDEKGWGVERDTYEAHRYYCPKCRATDASLKVRAFTSAKD